MHQLVATYAANLSRALGSPALDRVPVLWDALHVAWKEDRSIFICGNGGSAGNAEHMANDLLYGAGKANGRGMRVEALSANTPVITCLANDLGYENIFSEQLRVKAQKDDILIVLSGSGNSANVIKALEIAKVIGMKTFAILGFSGGRCKDLTQVPIHFEIEDMQVAEDLQQIIGHMCMQWLCRQVLPRGERSE